MKAVNILIAAMAAALVFSGYVLVSKLMPVTAPTEQAPATPTQSPSAPEPAAMHQEQPHTENPAQLPQTPMQGKEPIAEEPQAPAPPVKEEPKLRPVSDIKVVMYMTDWWPYCAQARSHLQSLGVSLTEYNIERDSSARSEMLSKSGGRTGVPLIDIEGVILRGFSPESIDAVVKSRQRS